MRAVLVQRGRGPERLEHGAILCALAELARAPRMVRLDIGLEQVPRSLRRQAQPTTTGVAFRRADLTDWCRSLRGARTGQEKTEWN